MGGLLIRGGSLVDGTGAPAVRADVLVRGDVIEAVAPEIRAEAEVFDATGLFVTPGFVDIHRHPDIALLSGWSGEIERRQGIATLVAGNCGMSVAPSAPAFRAEQYAFYEPVLGRARPGLPATFPEYLGALARARLPVNAGAMLGLGAVRIAIKGFSDAPFTRAEQDRAAGLVEEALDAGALGVSTGIMYVPECYNAPADFARMLAPLGARGGTLTAHIRGEGDSLVSSVREAIGIAADAGCRLQISHFKACGRNNWRSAIHRAIDEIEAARARGLDVGCDFYPYDGGSTALTTMLPPAFIGGDMKSAIARLGTFAGVDAFRRVSLQEHPGWDNFALTLGWGRILVSGVADPANEKFVGLDIETAAGRFGFSDGAALAAHLMHTDGGRTAIINMSMCREDIETVARLPYSCVISDALYAGAASPHPRLYGAFPKVIREFVRARGVLSLEEAVHKMSGLPASRLNLKRRGLVKPGYFADLLAFDPGTFRDEARYEAPKKLARGLSLMLVNGKISVRDDGLLPGAFGRIIRKGEGHED